MFVITPFCNESNLQVLALSEDSWRLCSLQTGKPRAGGSQTAVLPYWNDYQSNILQERRKKMC